MKKNIYTAIDIAFDEKEIKLINDTVTLLNNLLDDMEERFDYRYTCHMGGVPTKSLYNTVNTLSGLLETQLSFRSEKIDET